MANGTGESDGLAKSVRTAGTPFRFVWELHLDPHLEDKVAISPLRLSGRWPLALPGVAVALLLLSCTRGALQQAGCGVTLRRGGK